jgi:hypothetical protein
MTFAEALFLCRNKCRNDTPVFTVYKIDQKMWDESYFTVEGNEWQQRMSSLSSSLQDFVVIGCQFV